MTTFVAVCDSNLKVDIKKALPGGSGKYFDEKYWSEYFWRTWGRHSCPNIISNKILVPDWHCFMTTVLGHFFKGRDSTLFAELIVAPKKACGLGGNPGVKKCP